MTQWHKMGITEQNGKLLQSIKEVLDWEDQQGWTLEHMRVPIQTDGESCRYRM